MNVPPLREKSLGEIIALNLISCILWGLAVFFAFEWIAFAIASKFFFACSIATLTKVTLTGGWVLTIAIVFLVAKKTLLVMNISNERGTMSAHFEFMNPEILFTIIFCAGMALLPIVFLAGCALLYLMCSGDKRLAQIEW